MCQEALDCISTSRGGGTDPGREWETKRTCRCSIWYWQVNCTLLPYQEMNPGGHQQPCSCKTSDLTVNNTETWRHDCNHGDGRKMSATTNSIHQWVTNTVQTNPFNSFKGGKRWDGSSNLCWRLWRSRVRGKPDNANLSSLTVKQKSLYVHWM